MTGHSYCEQRIGELHARIGEQELRIQAMCRLAGKYREIARRVDSPELWAMVDDVEAVLLSEVNHGR